MFKFKPGRQGTGYEICRLYKVCWFNHFFDSYLIRFKESTYLPPHRDIVWDYDHFRMNIILKKPKWGGEFICDKVWSWLDRVYIFRPDKEEHSVKEVIKGTRIVLSFGFAKPRRVK